MTVKRTVLILALLAFACEEGEQSAAPTPTPTLTEAGAVRADCHQGWCLIPPGTYTKGSPTSELGRGAHLETQARIEITRPFILQQFESTVDRWVDSAGPSWSSERDHYFPEVDPDNPRRVLAALTWFEAVNFANHYSEVNGLSKCYELRDCRQVEVISALKPYSILSCGSAALAQGSTVYECDGYRLPTQAEWEYAARAGTETASYGGGQDLMGLQDYQWGGCIEQASLAPNAWYCWNSDDKLHLGGQKLPNGFGLHDMLGNVGEWAHGHFRPWGDASGVSKDPLGELNPSDPSRVSKLGGFFRSGAAGVRSAAHDGETLVDTFGSGVRLARTVKDITAWKEKLP